MIPRPFDYLSADVGAPRVWLVAGSAVAAFCYGVLVPLVTQSAPATILTVTIAAVPLLAWFATLWPAAGLGLMVALQPLEAFQFVTPIGDPSPSIILLAVLLVVNLKAVRSAYRNRPLFRTTLWILIVWIATYAFRMHYEDSGTVLRQMITVSSFVAIAVVGATLSEQRHVLLWLTTGATAALSILALLGALASLGAIPITSVSEAPRQMLGILSPFTRNYGLNLPNDTLDVLFPLAAAGPLLGLVHRASSWRLRFFCAICLLPVCLGALLVFQSRSMLAQLGVGLVLAIWLSEVPLRKLVIVPAIVGVALAARSLLSVDPTATTLHAQSIFGSILAVIHNPLMYAFGQNENALFVREATQAGLGQAIGGNNAVHNLFLSNLIGGGYLPFILIAVAYLRPVALMVLRSITLPARKDVKVLAIAGTMMVVSVSVEPVRAIVLGNWLILGLLLGHRAIQPRSEPTRVERWLSTAMPHRAVHDAS